MKILAYNINGQPVGTTVAAWKAPVGCPSFIHADSLGTLVNPPDFPPDKDLYLVDASATGDWAGHDGEYAYYMNGSWHFYSDITTLSNYDRYGKSAGLSIAHIREHLSELMTAAGGFASLTNVEKDIIGKYNIATDGEMIAHYAAVHTGGDVDAAIQKHTKIIGAYISEMKTIARYRAEHDETTACVLQYMADRAQIDYFLSAIADFIFYYKVKFHLGTQYGDTTDGIMDYLENTGSYTAAGTGLDSYQFSETYKSLWYAGNAVDPQNPTQAEQDAAHVYVRNLLRDRLKDIFVHGNI